MGGVRDGLCRHGRKIRQRRAEGGCLAALDGFQRQTLSHFGKSAAGAEALKGACLEEADRTVRRQTHMPDLACRIAGSGVQTPIENQPRTHAGAEGQKDHVPRPLARTEAPFRKSAGVGIVAKGGGKPQPGGEHIRDGNVHPAGQVGRLPDDAARGVHGTAAADADGADSLPLPRGGLRHGGGGIQYPGDGGGAVAGVKARFLQYMSLAVAAHDRAFRAADINAEIVFCVHACASPFAAG